MGAWAGRIAALVAGALFGLGLAISQMVNPDKVLSFLDVGAMPSGGWDPSLMLVLGAAVGVNLIGYRLAMGRPHPLFDRQFHLPTRSAIDARLVVGSALFGIGWGLAGYCPGPGVAGLTLGSTDPLWFVGAMLIGMFGFDRVDRALTAATA